MKITKLNETRFTIAFEFPVYNRELNLLSNRAIQLFDIEHKIIEADIEYYPDANKQHHINLSTGYFELCEEYVEDQTMMSFSSREDAYMASSHLKEACGVTKVAAELEKVLKLGGK